MKSVEFSEDELKDLSKLKEKLFGDENDPTSFNYKRKLERPKISWWRVALFFALWAALNVAVAVALSAFLVKVWIFVLSVIAANLLYIALTAKRALICAVKLYQKFAPFSLREKCRFEPSCSAYMIMAIEKHGVVKGVAKGLNRLKRCNSKYNGVNGGIDFP